jgi:hypothetical protein
MKDLTEYIWFVFHDGILPFAILGMAMWIIMWTSDKIIDLIFDSSDDIDDDDIDEVEKETARIMNNIGHDLFKINAEYHELMYGKRDKTHHSE